MAKIEKFNESKQITVEEVIEKTMKKIGKYMKKSGKTAAVDLFKKLDSDADLKVGWKELIKGFKRMGIYLEPEESEIIWTVIVGDQEKEKFEFTEFRKFFEKNKVNNNGTNVFKTK